MFAVWCFIMLDAAAEPKLWLWLPINRRVGLMCLCWVRFSLAKPKHTHTEPKKNKQHEQSTIKNYGNWRAVIFYERTQRAAAMGKTFSSTERNARTCQ